MYVPKIIKIDICLTKLLQKNKTVQIFITANKNSWSDCSLGSIYYPNTPALPEVWLLNDFERTTIKRRAFIGSTIEGDVTTTPSRQS